MGGGWWEPSDKAVFAPVSLEGLILEERNDTRLLEAASESSSFTSLLESYFLLLN